MKRIISALMSPLLLSSTVLSTVSCDEKKQLEIALVPSKDSSKMNRLKPKLTDLIENKLKQIDSSFNLKINIKLTGSYAIAAQGLATGNEAIAFLQAKLYCENRGTIQNDGTYDKAATLLAPIRKGIEAEKDLDDKTKTIQGDWKQTITAKESFDIVKNYNQIGNQIKTKNDIKTKVLSSNDNAQYYRSCIYANKNFLKGHNFDNIKNENDYIDVTKKIILKARDEKKLQLGKVNSSASYTYPLKWMKDVLKFSDDELRSIIKSQTPNNNVSSLNIEKLIDGNELLVAAGYGDIRTELSDDNIIKSYNNIQVIGVGDAVANDAIQYSRKWFKNEQKLLRNLRKAFCELVKDPNNFDIFEEIYSHKNYLAPDENATESEIIKWEADMDKAYSDIEDKFKNINTLIKNTTTN